MQTEAIEKPTKGTIREIDWRTDATLRTCLEVDRPVAVLGYDYAAGDRVPMHEHEKAQLIYAIEGTMMVTAAEGRWVLLPTRAVWVPARMRHAIQMRSALRMRTVYFDGTVTPPAEGCAAMGVSPLLRELIVSMQAEPMRYAAGSRAEHIASLISDELRQIPVLPLHLPSPKDARLRRVCEAMQRRPGIADGVEVWAARAEMSGRTLARLFRSELGMSFQEWRQQLLLLEAQVRLAQGQGSLRIARSLGYDSHAAFCAMFRRVLGVSPSEFQRLG